MEFAEITKDPFTNNTNNFYLVIDVYRFSIPTPSAPGSSSTQNGLLTDPSGQGVGRFSIMTQWDYAVAGSLSDEAFAHSYITKREWMLVPPNYVVSGFTAMIGFWLKPKEVEQFILGRLSLKGGD